ncbi:MAG: beta-ketoacyl synthase chain length factor [Bacteroidota bacterium]
MFVSAYSTISHQASFQRHGFSAKLTALSAPSEVVHPDYASLIPPMYRRRMTDVLKMSIACTMDCLAQVSVEQPGAIIVGTSMGCSTFTQRFLDKIYAARQGGRISPTSFILSTHNSIAGQISLLLGNHNYNMTHTQNSVSFEQGLMDAMLHLKDGLDNVLAGGADEAINALYNIHTRLGVENIHPSSGASFFLLTAEAKASPTVAVIDVESHGLISDAPSLISTFLQTNHLSESEIDLVLYASSFRTQVSELTALFQAEQLFDYQSISGSYLTNSAFAMAYGVDILHQGDFPFRDRQIRRILICNQVIPENIGLILLEAKTG